LKKVIIVTSSPRKGGNSETLADAFADGAKAAGNAVTKIAVRDLNLKFCTGCMFCQSNRGCVLNDGMNALYDEIENADVLVFSTPVYYYSVSGQLKTFLDRLNPLYPRKNKFREVYLLASAAENDGSAMDGSVSDINGWIACFEGVELKGVLRGVGLEERSAAANTAYPAQAYAMGEKV